MNVNKARKLTIKRNKNYLNTLNKLNKLIKDECKSGRFEMRLYRYATFKEDLCNSEFNSLIDYLRMNGFSVVHDQSYYIIKW